MSGTLNKVMLIGHLGDDVKMKLINEFINSTNNNLDNIIQKHD